MEKVRILHTGDLHLGSSFAYSRLPEQVGRMRRQELWETFSAIIEMVKKERVDILLIAGDLFEYDYCSTADVMRIDRKFREIEEVQVCISPGNHDPAVRDSLYYTYKWSPNVHIFKNRYLEGIKLDNLNTTVWGLGWDGTEIREELLKGFCASDDGINILLMHCDVVRNGYSSNYLPVLPDQLAICGVHYAALGHIHKKGEITGGGRVVARYCGSPEPLDFGEVGEHGVYTGDVGRDMTSIRFVPVAKRKFITRDIVIDPTYTPEKIIGELRSVVTALGDNNLYRFELVGNVDPAAEPDLDYIKKAVPAFYVSLENNTHPDYDFESIMEDEADGIKGIFVSKVLSKLKEESDPERKRILERALHIGLEALNGRKVLER